MELYDKAWDKFEFLIEEKKSCSTCMKELIEFLKPEMDKKTYDKLGIIDYQTEVSLVREHIISELKQKPLPENIKGIWFAISKYFDENKNIEYYVFYLTGSTKYDLNNNEWSTEFAYETESGIFLLEAMNEIDSIIRKDLKFCQLGDWIIPISYYSFIINECFMNNEFKKSFLLDKDEVGIAIGYDEGDYINLKIR